MYLYHLQKFFEDNLEKNILFEGFVNDISKRDGSYYVDFMANIKIIWRDRFIKLVLKCEYDDVKSLLENPPDRYENFLDPNKYVVISSIVSVKKIEKFQIEPSSSATGEFIFAATGKLIHLKKYPKDISHL